MISIGQSLMLYIEPNFVFIKYKIIIASFVWSIESDQVEDHHIKHPAMLLD